MERVGLWLRGERAREDGDHKQTMLASEMHQPLPQGPQPKWGRGPDENGELECGGRR